MSIFSQQQLEMESNVIYTNLSESHSLDYFYNFSKVELFLHKNKQNLYSSMLVTLMNIITSFPCFLCHWMHMRFYYSMQLSIVQLLLSVSETKAKAEMANGSVTESTEIEKPRSSGMKHEYKYN